MKAFGIDLGGSQIKICWWNADQNSSTGVGSEIVENDQGKRSSVYVVNWIYYRIVPASALKTFPLTFAVSVMKMYPSSLNPNLIDCNESC